MCIDFAQAREVESAIELHLETRATHLRTPDDPNRAVYLFIDEFMHSSIVTKDQYTFVTVMGGRTIKMKTVHLQASMRNLLVQMAKDQCPDLKNKEAFTNFDYQQFLAKLRDEKILTSENDFAVCEMFNQVLLVGDLHEARTVGELNARLSALDTYAKSLGMSVLDMYCDDQGPLEFIEDKMTTISNHESMLYMNMNFFRSQFSAIQRSSPPIESEPK